MKKIKQTLYKIFCLTTYKHKQANRVPKYAERMKMAMNVIEGRDMKERGTENGSSLYFVCFPRVKVP